MRKLRVAAAQLGPIQKADDRTQVVTRLLALLEQARGRGVELIVYPELALTTFFPRWYHDDVAAADHWYERALPGEATAPLFERARAYGIGFHLGYAELTPDGRRFNSAVLVDRGGHIVGKYRKVHLPGHAELDPERAFQHLEKRYFEPGDLGFPVWRTMGGNLGILICNDRRWPEAWRVLGLQDVELVLIGYNTPTANPEKLEEDEPLRLFHNRLVVQAGAYQNSCWAVAVAKAGVEDGHPLNAGSLIVAPTGEIVAELLVHDLDLDLTRFGKRTVFNFAAHRRIEHYGLITARTAARPPDDG
jgi:predicted amidohydrolase